MQVTHYYPEFPIFALQVEIIDFYIYIPVVANQTVTLLLTDRAIGGSAPLGAGRPVYSRLSRAEVGAGCSAPFFMDGTSRQKFRKAVIPTMILIVSVARPECFHPTAFLCMESPNILTDSLLQHKGRKIFRPLLYNTLIINNMPIPD